MEGLVHLRCLQEEKLRRTSIKQTSDIHYCDSPKRSIFNPRKIVVYYLKRFASFLKFKYAESNLAALRHNWLRVFGEFLKKCNAFII